MLQSYYDFDNALHRKSRPKNACTRRCRAGFRHVATLILSWNIFVKSLSLYPYPIFEVVLRDRLRVASGKKYRFRQFNHSTTTTATTLDNNIFITVHLRHKQINYNLQKKTKYETHKKMDPDPVCKHTNRTSPCFPTCIL